jgi:hypothetical protein
MNDNWRMYAAMCNKIAASSEQSANVYVHKPVTTAELRALAGLALQEIEDFFIRNPHLVSFYEDRFVAAALCQGAALQFVGIGYGVKDFDIHFFYRQNPTKRKLSRRVKRIIANVGQFADVPVDFVRTVVPQSLSTRFASPKALLRAFLEAEPTKSARCLAEKGVVGLLPQSIFGQVVWNGTRM